MGPQVPGDRCEVCGHTVRQDVVLLVCRFCGWAGLPDVFR